MELSMHKTIYYLLLMILSVFVQPVFGQQASTQPFYDPDKINTVQGTILNIKQVFPEWEGRYVQVILIQTDYGELNVYLAPSWFMERIHMRLTVGDAIEVTGAQTAIKDQQVMLAAELRKNEIIYRLRSKFDGSPVW
jgi:hypothetical protein